MNRDLRRREVRTAHLLQMRQVVPTLLAMTALRTIIALGAVLIMSGCRATATNSATDQRVAASVISYSPYSTPAKVRQEFHSRFPGAELINVQERTFKDGSVEYEVQYLKDGKSYSSPMKLASPR